MSTPPSASFAAATNSSPPAASPTSHDQRDAAGPMAAAASSIRTGHARRWRPGRLRRAAPWPTPTPTRWTPRQRRPAFPRSRAPCSGTVGAQPRTSAPGLDLIGRAGTPPTSVLGGDGAIDDRAGGDDAAGTDGDAGEDRRPGADPDAPLDRDRQADVPPARPSASPISWVAVITATSCPRCTSSSIVIGAEVSNRHPSFTKQRSPIDSRLAGSRTAGHPDAATDPGTVADPHPGESQQPEPEAAERVARAGAAA